MTDPDNNRQHPRFPDAVREQLSTAEGRRALRASHDLDHNLADILLSYNDDFRSARRDRTLALVVHRASTDMVLQHAVPIAEGAAAGALWERLSVDTSDLQLAVQRVIEVGSAAADRSIASWLLLDPVGDIGISDDQRTWIAEQLLSANDPESRGLAAEALFDINPASLLPAASELVTDASERVRSYTWNALMRADRERGLDLAIRTLSDAELTVDVRKSAMVAMAEALTTTELEDFFAELVGNPDRDIALAAAHLFQHNHRSPVIAAAAAQSPHEEVREIARILMDPFRGSPAAGGSRPGDPTGGDVFAEMLRRLGDDDQETDW